MYLFVNITNFELYSVSFICGFDIVNEGENPQGKSIFVICACAVGVWLMCACVFVTKTMEVRIFQSAKLTNFGGIFFPIVHLFRLGSSGYSNQVSFYLSIRVKIM